MLYTLGNVCIQPNTIIYTFNESADPYVGKRSQELYDALNRHYNIVSWACGRYGQRTYSVKLGQEWKIKMEEHIQKTRESGITIDFAIQMCGHPTMVQPYPYFIFSDFMPYIDISELDDNPFPNYKKNFVHEQDELYQKASGVICLTPLSKKMVIDYHGVRPSNTTVIASGVNDHMNNWVKQPEKIILWVGTDYVRKAGEDVLNAFARLRKDDPEYELHMVGIKKDISQKGVFIYPFMSNSEISVLTNLYEKAKLFVMPSYRENAGLVYFEALAYGTPVICTTRGGSAEIIRRSHCGKVVKPGDVDAIYTAMKDMIKNDIMYNWYSKNAFRFSSDNTYWDIAIKRMKDAIGKWLNNESVQDDYIKY